MKESKQKNIIIGSLIAVIVVMAIGYAAFATQLNINGSAAITSNWCVGFDNTKTSTYTTTTGVSGATAPTGTMSYSGNTCATVASTVATLNTTLHQPGDRVVYTLTILNKGSVDATIDSVLVDDVAKTASYTETKGNIKFTVTMPVSNTVVATSGSTTMTVTAEFQNDTPVSSLDQAETQSINIKINAGEGGSSPAPSSLIIDPTFVPQYYEYHTYDASGDVVIGNAADTSSWTQDPSTLNKDYYLGHDVENGVVTANYACFILNNTQYCMKSSTDGSTFTTNKALLGTLKDATPPAITCSSFGSDVVCSSDRLGLLTAPGSGTARAGLSSSLVYCSADYDGYSYCLE